MFNDIFLVLLIFNFSEPWWAWSHDVCTTSFEWHFGTLDGTGYITVLKPIAPQCQYAYSPYCSLYIVKVLTRRIWSTMKSTLSWWSFPLFLQLQCVILANLGNLLGHTHTQNYYHKVICLHNFILQYVIIFRVQWNRQW